MLFVSDSNKNPSSAQASVSSVYLPSCIEITTTEGQGTRLLSVHRMCLFKVVGKTKEHNLPVPSSHQSNTERHFYLQEAGNHLLQENVN